MCLVLNNSAEIIIICLWKHRLSWKCYFYGKQIMWCHLKTYILVASNTKRPFYKSFWSWDKTSKTTVKIHDVNLLFLLTSIAFLAHTGLDILQFYLLIMLQWLDYTLLSFNMSTATQKAPWELQRSMKQVVPACEHCKLVIQFASKYARNVYLVYLCICLVLGRGEKQVIFSTSDYEVWNLNVCGTWAFNKRIPEIVFYSISKRIFIFGSFPFFI